VGRTMTTRLTQKGAVKAVTVGAASAAFTNRADAKTNLQQITVTLPESVPSGGSAVVTIEYTLPLADNSALAAISPVGGQFLPLSAWYPTPNTQFSLRGADTAPFRLSVNAGGDLNVLSSGRANGGNVFEQPLYAQPFFLTGKWDVIEGAGEARGVSAWLPAGPSAEERARAESVITLAAAARSYFASVFGAAPDVPVRLVAVSRGAGFNDGGVVLLSPAIFARTKIDSVSALAVGEAVVRLWLGGATPLRGEGASALREGLARFLATTFLEKQFGREAADTERTRERTAYAAIAKRDSPIAQSAPSLDTHFNTTANKGAMVWRLSDRALGREAFFSLLSRELQAKRTSGLTLAAWRAALVEGGGQNLKALLDYGLDQPTETDLLIGLPQQRGGEWVAALRNTGPVEAAVTTVAVTEAGERLTSQAVIPAKDFGEARFKTAGRIARVEIDPEKYYPQTDYNNDVAPRPQVEIDPLVEATRLYARQEYAKAEAMAREALIAAPRMQEARIILARTLLAADKLDEAAKEFRAALDDPLPLPTTFAWANVGLGEIAQRRGQNAEAAKFFDAAVRADAEYGATLAGRQGRIKAEAAGGSAPAIDESARAFLAQLDTAIRSGRKAELDALVVPGELSTFTSGIIGNQPEVWQTKVLRTERLDANRVAADVSLATKVLGKEQAGTAVLILARVGGNWKLVGVEFFEVR
ncbi:MAG TPA: hypothetical protein VM870_02540, partial [Pyrinomonadaceae bacterium]|nr:hypothetical protein [Pyrinomonadaceae bacterium]